MGVLGNLDYKFEEDSIVKSFSELNYWLNIGTGSYGLKERKILLNEILNSILAYYYIIAPKNIRGVSMESREKGHVKDVINEMKNKNKILKNRKMKAIYYDEKIEEILYGEINKFLEILVFNEKVNITNTLSKIIGMEEWKGCNINKKIEYIKEYSDELYKNKIHKFKNAEENKIFLNKLKILLEEALKLEGSQELLLELDSLIRRILFKLPEIEIYVKVKEIKRNSEDNLKQDLKNYINKLYIEEKHKYLFKKEHWTELNEKIEEILELKNGKWEVK